MTATTVLAALSRWFSHPENIATEALLHIIRAPVATREMSRLVRELAPQCGPALHWKSQAADAEAIPDLLGVDASGNEVVILENKFWAGLTDAQPCTYIERLRDRPSLILFVAPAARATLIWPELLRRCRIAGIGYRQETERADFRLATIGDRQVLALVSWRALLSRLRAGARDAREEALCGDIDQLIGLCDLMDSEAFLPLRSEELTDYTARRIVQFNELIDELTAALAEKGLASRSGRAAGSRGTWSYHLVAHGYGLKLYCNAPLWARYGQSPIWVRVTDSERWYLLQEITDYLQSVLPEIKVVHSEEEGGSLVPIHLPTGVEWDEVVRAAMAQLHRVIGHLSAKPRAAVHVTPPPADTP